MSGQDSFKRKKEQTDKKLQSCIDYLIQERMQDQFAAREGKVSEEELQQMQRLEAAFEAAVALLPPERERAVREYSDYIFDNAENEEFFYRLGLRDGIRMQRFLRKLLDDFAA